MITEQELLDQEANRMKLDRLTLENIYMLAKRENNRKGQDERNSEMWGHVIRLCEAAGLTSSVLRAKP